MSNDLEQKSDDELWAQWQYHATAAGRIMREIDRRQRPLPAKQKYFRKPEISRRETE